MFKSKLLCAIIFLLIIFPVAHHKPSLSERTPPYEIKYHSYSEVSQLVLQLNSSPYVDVKIIGYSVNGSPIYVIRISTDLSSYKPAIVRNFGQHAREYITTETALFLAYYLNDVLKGNVRDDNATSILSVFDVYIIPCANPDGHDIAMFHNERQRKNVEPIDEDGDGLIDEDPPEDANGDGYIDLYYSSSGLYLGAEGDDNDGDGVAGEDRVGGVDLNRNRPRHRGEPSGASSETYPGPRPLSEPESLSIYRFLKSLGPVALFDIHSGIKALLYPPGTDYGKTTLQDIFSEMSRVAIKHNREAMPSINLYPAYGTLDEDGYFDIHAISITLEIFGNRSRPKYEEMPNGNRRGYGVKRMFNPMPSKLLDSMREAADVILGCTYVIYKHVQDLPEAKVTYKVYGNSLSIFVSPKKYVVREAYALLIGENMTRFVQLVDNLDGTLVGSINLDSSGLKDGRYALVILYHATFNRGLEAFEINVTDVYHDSNGNGVDDERELARNVTSIDTDEDGDGLTSYEEYLIGTNPSNNDTDFDGIIDGEEYALALLAVFRGSDMNNLPYLRDHPEGFFFNTSKGVFAEAVGTDRRISYTGDARVYLTRDVAFAFYEGAHNLTIVISAEGESRMFYRKYTPSSGESESAESGGSNTLLYGIIAAIVAVVVIVIIYLIISRREKRVFFIVAKLKCS